MADIQEPCIHVEIILCLCVYYLMYGKQFNQTVENMEWPLNKLLSAFKHAELLLSFPELNIVERIALN